MKVFFDHEISSFWSYEKPIWKNSSHAFYLVIATKYFLEHITFPKSDCWFYKWSNVAFQKNESLGVRKEKLVCEASHVNHMKNATHKK